MHLREEKKKSTYHTQLFPHLRKAKGEKEMYFKYFKIISQQTEFMINYVLDCTVVLV